MPLRQRFRRCRDGISSQPASDDGEHPAQRSWQRRNNRISAQRVRVLFRFRIPRSLTCWFSGTTSFGRRGDPASSTSSQRAHWPSKTSMHATHRSAYKKKKGLQPGERSLSKRTGMTYKKEQLPGQRKPYTIKDSKHFSKTRAENRAKRTRC